MKKGVTALVLSTLALTTGCATVTSGTTQNLSVSSKTTAGNTVAGSSCKLKNDKGEWSVVTPNTVTVHKSSKDLNIVCNKDGHKPGTARAISRAGAGMAGNLLVGGIIGAGIDHSTGSAYNYSDDIVVTMGSTTVIDRRTNKASAEKNPKQAQAK